MLLSLDIIIDRLSNLKYEVPGCPTDELRFRRASMLHHSKAVLNDDTVYVCRLSNALSMSSRPEGITYICVRDRFKDEAESVLEKANIVIINENLSVEQLFSMIQDIFISISEWYCDMQRAIIEKSSLQHIVELSLPILGNTINITDSAFNLLARTSSLETDDELSCILEKNGCHPEATVRLFIENHRYEVWREQTTIFHSPANVISLSKYDMLTKILRLHSKYFAHVVMVCDHRPLTAGLSKLFRFFTEFISIYADNNLYNRVSYSQNYDPFIKQLLSGELTEESTISEKASVLGINDKGRMVLHKYCIAPGMEDMLGRIAQELSELSPSSQVVFYDDSVVEIRHLSGKSTAGDKNCAEFKEFLLRRSLFCGSSNEFSSLASLQRAFMQAGIAIKYGTDYSSDKQRDAGDRAKRPYGDFENELLKALLCDSAQNEILWRSSNHYRRLSEISRYDKLHDTNNLTLLRAYLDNERKATETGALLHMHRNNVIYRIGKLENLFDIDLSSSEARTNLTMAFIMSDVFGLDDAVGSAE